MSRPPLRIATIASRETRADAATRVSRYPVEPRRTTPTIRERIGRWFAQHEEWEYLLAIVVGTFLIAGLALYLYACSVLPASAVWP